MVDVSGKDITLRTAAGRGRIVLGGEAFEAFRRGECPKGDVLEAARIAATNAVKLTPSMIPMCHTILIEAVSVDFVVDEVHKSIGVTVEVKSTGKTGVEMESLVGAAAACLTIYDMLKFKSKGMVIEQITLLEKTGGKSGDYKRQD